VKPLAIDLYAGLGGWAEGLLAEGWQVFGFDIERHDYGTGVYPGELALQDVLTIHGSQFRDAALIVASPPCQAYSYRAMPWKRAKALPPPDNSLFDACFRIQFEASEAAGRYIPMVVENVCGAQRWVGRAKWHFGSFYLWGDVPALMPPVSKQRGKKNDGGSWFDVACNTLSGHGRNPVNGDTPAARGQKVPGFRFDGSGRSFQSASVARKGLGPGSLFGSERADPRDERRDPSGDWGVKQAGMSGPLWFDAGAARHGSRSNARKAASAMIAKIPPPLARWIGQCYYPTQSQGATA